MFIQIKPDILFVTGRLVHSLFRWRPILKTTASDKMPWPLYLFCSLLHSPWITLLYFCKKFLHKCTNTKRRFFWQMLPKSISVVPSIISMIVISDRELYQYVCDQQVFFTIFQILAKIYLPKAIYPYGYYPYGWSSSSKKQIKWEPKYIKQSTTLSSQLYLA